MTPQRSAANTVRGADESDHANRRTKTRAGPWSANASAGPLLDEADNFFKCDNAADGLMPAIWHGRGSPRCTSGVRSQPTLQPAAYTGLTTGRSGGCLRTTNGAESLANRPGNAPDDRPTMRPPCRRRDGQRPRVGVLRR
jgi:hypothetical protein